MCMGRASTMIANTVRFETASCKQKQCYVPTSSPLSNCSLAPLPYPYNYNEYLSPSPS